MHCGKPFSLSVAAWCTFNVTYRDNLYVVSLKYYSESKSGAQAQWENC